MVLARSSNEAKFGTSPSGPMEDRFKSLRARLSVRMQCDCETNCWERRRAAKFAIWAWRESPAANYSMICSSTPKQTSNHRRKKFGVWSSRPILGRSSAIGEPSGLTTELLKDYRRKRRSEKRSESTCNRELSILRTALNLARKCTPPKVSTMPVFPDGRRNKRPPRIFDRRAVRKASRQLTGRT